MHRSSGACLGRGILTSQVAVATPCARFSLLTLDAGLCAGLAGVGDTASAGGRVDAPPLGAIAIIVMVGTVSLEQISTPKSLAADLNHDISDGDFSRSMRPLNGSEPHARQDAKTYVTDEALAQRVSGYMSLEMLRARISLQTVGTLVKAGVGGMAAGRRVGVGTGNRAPACRRRSTGRGGRGSDRRRMGSARCCGRDTGRCWVCVVSR